MRRVLSSPSCRTIAGVVSLAVLSAGCSTGIRFEAHTVVSSTGAVSRTTRFIGDSEERKNELQRQYELPLGGTWKTESKEWNGGNGVRYQEFVYQVERRCEDGCPPFSDHVRRAESSERTARNEIRVVVRNYLFVKTFAYEERFRDIVTRAEMEQGVRKLYDSTVETIARALVTERDDRVPSAQVSAAIRTSFDPLLEKYLGILHREGWRPFANNGTLSEELEAQFNTESIAERIATAVPPPPGKDDGAWRLTIVRVLEQVEKVEPEPAVGEMFSGSYGFQLFSRYAFAIDASLPGTLVETNATSREGGLLKWTFTPDAFFIDDYVLRARSRIVYPLRIALSTTALLASLFWWGLRRRQPVH